MTGTSTDYYVASGRLDDDILRWLDEDVGDGDVTTVSTIPAGTKARGLLRAKESGVIAGLAVAERVFAMASPPPQIRFMAADGDRVPAGAALSEIAGTAASILTRERLALNIVQRMSGIATATARMVDLVRPHGARVLDTRKTAPGLRALDKWAVAIGGGHNHRFGLYDMILVKDNHIAAAGGVAAAIRAAVEYRDRRNADLLIEVEVRTMEEIHMALSEAGVDRLLLDNMVSVEGGSVDTSRLSDAVALVGGRVATEASGNVTERTVAAIAATGVDFISVGALTHSVRALDVALDITLDS